MIVHETGHLCAHHGLHHAGCLVQLREQRVQTGHVTFTASVGAQAREVQGGGSAGGGDGAAGVPLLVACCPRDLFSPVK